MPFNPPVKATGDNTIKRDFTQYVAKATKVIFSPQTREAIMTTLKGPGDPVQKTADITVMVMQRVDTMVREAGLEMQDSIRIFAGHEIVKSVAEFAEAAAAFKLNDDLVLLATSLAAQDYIKAETKAGRINAKTLEVQMQADLRKMPEKNRREIMEGAKKVQGIARKYNGGNGSISTAVN